MNKRSLDNFLGCVLGGAVGDALGAPVEFWSYKKIIEAYGGENVAVQIAEDLPKLKFTDDTQMTLFTIEGLINFAKFSGGGESDDPTPFIHDSYLDWLFTQTGSYSMIPDRTMPGESKLLQIRELHEQRAPGATCLTSLESQIRGTVKDPINNRKGCGGVMRVAPIGLCYPPKKAFSVACDAAAITHGHPTGYIASGVLASIIAFIIEGQEILEAINRSLEVLPTDIRSDETRDILEQAIELAKHDLPSTDAIEMLGDGWIAEEALAIAIYCCLRAPDNLRAALSMAVCHKGDSDSTGAIAGNILGAYHGKGSIPPEWLDKLEIKDEMTDLAEELFNSFLLDL